MVELAPEELAHSLLKVAAANLQNGSVHRSVVISIDQQPGQERPYGRRDEPQVEVALIEALHWLETNAILLPAPSTNGQNGYRILGRRGKALLERDQFDAFRQAAAFPKSLLHPLIADRVWIALA